MPNKSKGATDSNRGGGKSRAGAHVRSRLGCATCKAKRTKCDETRPECLRCTSRGIKCGGYWREFKWSFKYQPDKNDSTFRESLIGAPANHQTVISATTSQPDESVSSATSPSEASSKGHIKSTSPSPGSDKDSAGQSPPLPLPADPVAGDADAATAPRPRPKPRTVSGSSERAKASRGVLAKVPQTVNPLALEPRDRFSHVPVLTTAPITDTTTLLISNWFEQVCPAWSGFDSNANLNRKLAIDLWHESTLVFSALQSMSAAFLATRLPQMRQPAIQFMQTATQAIHNEVSLIKCQPQPTALPMGLLFALFCLGTTTCWIDATLLGLPFFREARFLLNHLNRHTRVFQNADSDMLAFFNKSMAYWDMLVAVVSNDDPADGIEESPFIPPPQPSSAVHEIIDDQPHPWTGVSSTTSTLFAQTIRLCRNFRHQIRQRRQRDFETALRAIQEAQKLEEQLLELEFPQNPLIGETGDQRTPLLHLSRVAESYQLSSLLQLYQTFPDLVSLRLPMDSIASSGYVKWEDWITPLSLRLVQLLEHIPPYSGSRVIQPLLYISASTGLRYDTKTMMDALDASQQLSSIDLEPQQGILGADPESLTPNFISRTSLDISNARQFIMGRLTILENTLPPKPVIMARQLIVAVWDAYDAEEPGSTSVHWLDVMEENNLRSMFG